MKKIIATLFLFLYFTPAMATTKYAKGTYNNPVTHSSIRNIWELRPSSNYDDSLSIDGNGFLKKDTKTDNGTEIHRVHISAAKKIFGNGNGIEVCTMRLEHNNNNYKPWIDHNCHTFCLNGYYGNECNTRVASLKPGQQSAAPEDSDFLTIFKPGEDTSNNDNAPENEEIDTFGVNAWSVIPLVVVDVKQHAVQVRPILIGSDTSTTKIDHVKYHGEPTWVCANGYTGTNGDCTRLDGPPRCPTGKGFHSEDDTTCVTCGETKKSGVKDNGVCEPCATDQIFSNTSDGCVSAIKLDRQKMRENTSYTTHPKCWSLIENDTYEECVKTGRNS